MAKLFTFTSWRENRLCDLYDVIMDNEKHCWKPQEHMNQRRESVTKGSQEHPTFVKSDLFGFVYKAHVYLSMTCFLPRDRLVYISLLAVGHLLHEFLHSTRHIRLCELDVDWLIFVDLINVGRHIVLLNTFKLAVWTAHLENSKAEICIPFLYPHMRRSQVLSR